MRASYACCIPRRAAGARGLRYRAGMDKQIEHAMEEPVALPQLALVLVGVPLSLVGLLMLARLF